MQAAGRRCSELNLGCRAKLSLALLHESTILKSFREVWHRNYECLRWTQGQRASLALRDKCLLFFQTTMRAHMESPCKLLRSTFAYSSTSLLVRFVSETTMMRWALVNVIGPRKRSSPEICMHGYIPYDRFILCNMPLRLPFSIPVPCTSKASCTSVYTWIACPGKESTRCYGLCISVI